MDHLNDFGRNRVTFFYVIEKTDLRKIKIRKAD